MGRGWEAGGSGAERSGAAALPCSATRRRLPATAPARPPASGPGPGPGGVYGTRGGVTQVWGVLPALSAAVKSVLQVPCGLLAFLCSSGLLLKWGE